MQPGDVGYVWLRGWNRGAIYTTRLRNVATSLDALRDSIEDAAWPETSYGYRDPRRLVCDPETWYPRCLLPPELDPGGASDYQECCPVTYDNDWVALLLRVPPDEW